MRNYTFQDSKGNIVTVQALNEDMAWKLLDKVTGGVEASADYYMFE